MKSLSRSVLLLLVLGLAASLGTLGCGGSAGPREPEANDAQGPAASAADEPTEMPNDLGEPPPPANEGAEEDPRSAGSGGP
jgi:hypothetical protein